MRTRETRKRHLQVELLEGRFALSGGVVLPPNAMPHGYSLTNMARETALFLTSGNTRTQDHPNTPFQVLYYDPQTFQAKPTLDGGVARTGSNRFNVSPGTSFYVPIASADDSTPIVGNYPTDASGTVPYFFGQDQLGGNFTITVDGKSTSVGPAYLVGPVNTPPLLDAAPPPLPNGTPGTHIITLGVFLSPMSAGTHKVEVKGEFAGQGIHDTYGVNFISGDFTYTVHVG